MTDSGLESVDRKRVVIVTASDSGYFDLARDLINSVHACSGSMTSLAFLDLGITEQQNEWLRDRGVVVRPPETRLRLGSSGQSLRNMGYLARPYLRENFPGYEVYVWLDADTWLQDASAITGLVAGAREKGAAMVRQNDPAYRLWLWLIGWMHKHFVLGNGFVPGIWLASRPMINNGVFAMMADAPHWDRWHVHYQKSFDRTALAAPHDQFALNAAVYLDRLQTAFLPSKYNWICDLAPPLWDAEIRKFRSPRAPFDIISVMHLAGSAKNRTFELQTKAGNTVNLSLRYNAAMQ
ncbi:hypothetical protein ACVWWK_008058 [Bradyrhizobium sp. LB9.1b]